jgi:hypothetical protein
MLAWMSFWTLASCGALGFLFQIWPVEFGRRCCDLAVALVSTRLPKRVREAWFTEWNDTVEALMWEETRRGSTERRIGLLLIGEAIALVMTGWTLRRHYRRVCGGRVNSWGFVANRVMSGTSILLAGAAELWLITSAFASGATASLWGTSVDGLILPAAIGMSSWVITETLLSLRRGTYSTEMSLDHQRNLARVLFRIFWLYLGVSVARVWLTSAWGSQLVPMPELIALALIVCNRVLTGLGLVAAIRLEMRQFSAPDFSFHR